MRYITEQELREAFEKGVPEAYALPPGAKLTPSARQYLADLRLLPAESAGHSRTGKPSGPKPEHMTHLGPEQLVHKTHPRIVLRGKLDALEADILLAQIAAQELSAHAIASQLEAALALVRQVLGAEVTGKPLGNWTLEGMEPQEIREVSHQPQRFGFSSHVLPVAGQGKLAAILNRLRTHVREVELQAAAAFCREGGSCEREDILLALNRLSSYVYILQLTAIKGQEGEAWNAKR